MPEIIIKKFNRAGTVAQTLKRYGIWYTGTKGMFALNIYLGPRVVNIDILWR